MPRGAAERESTGSEVHGRRLLVFLVLVAVALAAVLVQPFWKALFLAAVFAAVLARVMEWLSRKLRGRRSVAAAILTVALLVAVVLPLAGLGAVIVARIVEGVQWLKETVQSEGVQGLVGRLPGPAQYAARQVLDAIPRTQEEIQRLAGQGGSQAAAAVGGVLAATGTLVFQAVMMLIAFFFLLTDGVRLVEWLGRHVPLRPGQFRTLVNEFRQTSVSVVVASLGTAAIQTAAAFVGYLIARAPNLTFLVVATFVLALIPAVGGTAMVIAVGLLLLATGKVLAGIFLIAWGAAVVSLSDNLARPYLLKGGLELHGGLVFFALLGGLAVFGGIGLLVGPLVLTFLVTVVNLYRREFGMPAEPAEPKDSPREAKPSA
jgi:predicted PurR-regulated permease PerM